ncbi:MAG: class I SAM-dependent methyltransferase [Candidatus Aminicenantes bacterium]|nr:class I SAM-dependent methyltransferase [Candidatus Aminicenantes bacterium]
MKIINFIIRVLKRIFRVFLSDRYKTAQHWDQTDSAASSEYWWNFKIIRGFIQKEITGDAFQTWHQKKISEKPGTFGRVLAFGDGYGMVAEAFIKRKDVKEIVYLNISKGEGIRFKNLVEKHNFSIPCPFIQADANTFDYSSLGSFDTIIDVGAFHHFENFEFIFPQLNDLLKPGGIMYVDEYVGPSKLKFERPVIDIINDWLTSLPGELIACSKPVTRRDYKKIWQQCGDPSEGIRSGDLDTMLRRYFELVEAVSFGGTLLQPFFFTSNMIPCRLNIENWHRTDAGRSELERLVRTESELINSGEIQKDYMYYIFKKRARAHGN